MRQHVVTGTALYLRNMHAPDTQLAAVERAAVAFAKRAKRMGLSWIAIGAVWQEPKEGGGIHTKFLNSPAECRIWARVLSAEGIVVYVWGYPWLGAEDRFIDGMCECSGDDGLHLLDPELGANPVRSHELVPMQRANESATKIVSGLRVRGAKVIILSTFGGVPRWFPLRAYLKARINGAGGQTYTDDRNIDTSIASFDSEIAIAKSDAQLVPNWGAYARDPMPDGSTKVRSKTRAELRKHLDEFVNEGENVKAAIGWAENFMTPALDEELALFSARLAERNGLR